MKSIPSPSKSRRSTIFRQKANIFRPARANTYSVAFLRPLPKLRGQESRGLFVVGNHSFQCAIGRSGIGRKMREGDGVTPLGRYHVLFWLHRPDEWRGSRPGAKKLSKLDGWCDETGASLYNRPVKLPVPISSEKLWRDDRIYDLIGVIDYNWRPRVQGRGSAIFIHIARVDLQPTEGCLAFKREELRKLQFLLATQLQLLIGPSAIRPRSPKIAEPTRT
jgi:L,D-peptidoglycan transpeptidase YkuD (ErfK/YbiS/YcfS/YnhG family)